MIYEVKKPLYETEDGVVVGIYDQRVKKAIQKRDFLVIKCGQYQEVFMPKWIRENCQTIRKTFLRPNEPMTLYKVFIPRKKGTKQRS